MLFTGLYEDIWYMTSWVVYRHYVLFAMQVASRPFPTSLSSTAVAPAPPRAPRSLPRAVLLGLPLRPSYARRSRPPCPLSLRLVLPLLCLAAAVLLEVLDASVLGSSTYYHILEEWAGSTEPQFFMVLAIVLLLTLIVVVLVVAATAWKKPPKALRTMGSTTLGCYVMHW